ncbi:MAG: glucoamylase family protein [Candidatus Ancaeobacter aquaticus]|nr:glucoamylase family protein [Candidatus Ancaeobacter aquaticus]
MAKNNRHMRNIYLATIVLSFCIIIGAMFLQNSSSDTQNTTSGETAGNLQNDHADRCIIDDFESGVMGNNLNGNSGAWEEDPSNREQYCRASIVSAQPRVKDSKYLRLDYDVESSIPVSNGYWTLLNKFDMSGYDHLEFWVKGDKELGYTTTFKIECKKKCIANEDEEKKKVYGDPQWVKGSYIVTGITDQWQRVRIPLNVMNGIRHWSGMDELVIVFKDRLCDKKTGTILIDDIAVVKTGDPGPSIYDEVKRHQEKGIRGLSKIDTAKYLIEKRLGGKFPTQVVVKKEFSVDDRAFLKEIARDTWKYFELFVDKDTHLPLDTIVFTKDTVLGDETIIGDYTNVTNIGIYLMCIVSAHDLGFISRDEAIKRITQTIDSVEKMEKYSNNFPYNYYDTSTLERTSYFISSVDSGWLVLGLYVVRNAFKEELYGRATSIIDAMDFSFFYDEVEQHMSHGYYTNIQYPSEYNYGIFYTEPRAVSYMAIGKGDIPIEHWFKLHRTFPAKYKWQQMDPENRHEKVYLGVPMYGGYYEYDGLKYVPSWGGSLFEALMPTLVIEEKQVAPEGLGMNDKVHALLHARYALGELGYPVWGMSPSSVPGDGYSEYGVPILGSRGYKTGVVTPHVTFLALEFVPKEAIKNMRVMIELYDIYGECGFYDAVDPHTGKVSYKYLALDQGMILIALNNYLNDGAIRKRFAQDDVNNNAKKLLEVEKLLE